jgi:purine-binding chemotaxis protein CheW
MSADESSLQVCSFALAGFWFAIPVGRVHEVLRAVSITRVPLAPPVVRGIINLRGQLVSAIDLRARLDLAPNDASPMAICVRVSEGLASLLVDEIGEVITVDRDSFEAPPATTDPHIRPFLSTVCKQADRLLLLLDLDRVIDLGDSVGASDARKG